MAELVQTGDYEIGLKKPVRRPAVSTIVRQASK
jgi:hypothetical protein